MPEVRVIAWMIGNSNFPNPHHRLLRGDLVQSGGQAVAVDQHQVGIGQLLPLAGAKPQVVRVFAGANDAAHLGLISSQGFGQVAEDPVGTDHHWCRCTGSCGQSRSACRDPRGEPRVAHVFLSKNDNHSRFEVAPGLWCLVSSCFGLAWVDKAAVSRASQSQGPGEDPAAGQGQIPRGCSLIRSQTLAPLRPRGCWLD